MDEVTVLSIVEAYLRAHGYDGLYYEGDCGCLLDDLAPCGEMDQRCRPGVRQPCSCEWGCKWHVGPRDAAGMG